MNRLQVRGEEPAGGTPVRRGSLCLIAWFILGQNRLGQKRTSAEQILAFQIFTYGPNPRVASMGEGKNPLARFPDKATLRDYIEDIKRRIGTVGDQAAAAQALTRSSPSRHDGRRSLCSLSQRLSSVFELQVS